MKKMKQILLVASMICLTILNLSAQNKIGKATPAQIVNDKATLKKFKEKGWLKQAPSGLLYRLQEYEGMKIVEKPAKYSKVNIKYSIKTIDYKETIHDWGGENAKAAEVELNKLPYGIQECIRMMKIGSSCSFVLPPKLAKNKYGVIGGGRALTGVIELVSVVP